MREETQVELKLAIEFLPMMYKMSSGVQTKEEQGRNAIFWSKSFRSLVALSEEARDHIFSEEVSNASFVYVTIRAFSGASDAKRGNRRVLVAPILTTFYNQQPSQMLRALLYIISVDLLSSIRNVIARQGRRREAVIGMRGPLGCLLSSASYSRSLSTAAPWPRGSRRGLSHGPGAESFEATKAWQPEYRP